MYQNPSALIEKYPDDHLEILKAIGGFYETIKDHKGNRLTPLVGYAKTYDAGHNKVLQLVGDVYVNVAKAEEYPIIMSYFAKRLSEKMNAQRPLVYVGPQMGGVAIAQFLGFHASGKGFPMRYACAEKKVTQLKTAELREQSIIEFSRHDILPGDEAVICEDVLNNFSTTDQLIDLVKKKGAKVVAICGILNRSEQFQAGYVHDNKHIPVISLIQKSFEQYKQDDKAVIEDIVRKNVVLKPKDEWKRLTDAINKAQQIPESIH